MKKEVNLLEILKDVPIGTKLYSLMYGECFLYQIKREDHDHPIVIRRPDNTTISFTKEGHWHHDYPGECLIFPAKDNYDWSTFKVEKGSFQVGDHIMWNKTGEVYLLIERKQTRGFEATVLNSSSPIYSIYIKEENLQEYIKVDKFNHNWLKPYDRVLVTDYLNGGTWLAASFSHITKDEEYPYVINSGHHFKYCIPYNDETKYLIGTREKQPDFYKI